MDTLFPRRPHGVHWCLTSSHEVSSSSSSSPPPPLPFLRGPRSWPYPPSQHTSTSIGPTDTLGSSPEPSPHPTITASLLTSPSLRDVQVAASFLTPPSLPQASLGQPPWGPPQPATNQHLSSRLPPPCSLTPWAKANLPRSLWEKFCLSVHLVSHCLQKVLPNHFLMRPRKSLPAFPLEPLASLSGPQSPTGSTLILSSSLG